MDPCCSSASTAYVEQEGVKRHGEGRTALTYRYTRIGASTTRAANVGRGAEESVESADIGNFRCDQSSDVETNCLETHRHTVGPTGEQVQPRWDPDLGLGCPTRRPQASPQPVASHGRTERPLQRETDPGVVQGCITQRDHVDGVAATMSSLVPKSSEVARAGEPSDHALRRFRPLRRRLATMRRPALVDIR